MAFERTVAHAPERQKFDDGALLQELRTLLDEIQDTKKKKLESENTLEEEKGRLFDGMRPEHSTEYRSQRQRYDLRRAKLTGLIQRLEQRQAELAVTLVRAQERMTRIMDALDRGLIEVSKRAKAEEIYHAYETLLIEGRDSKMQR